MTNFIYSKDFKVSAVKFLIDLSKDIKLNKGIDFNLALKLSAKSIRENCLKEGKNDSRNVIDL